MKTLLASILQPSREARLAITVVLLSSLAGVAWGAERTLAAALFALTAVAVIIGYELLVVRPARIPRDAVLMVRLAGDLPEHPSRSRLDRLLRRGVPNLFDVRSALEAAASDPRVSTVAVEIAPLDVGYASAQELHEMLRAVHRGGKRVVTVLVGDGAGVREYYIAAGAGEIIANPDALLSLTGLAAGAPFLRRAFERLDVQVQTIQWKEYKGAAETLSRDGMSPELRESLDTLLADTEDAIVKAVANSRHLEEDRARQLLRSGFQSVRAACEAGLIDRAGYMEDLKAELDPERKERRFIGLGRYLRHVEYARERGKRARIALVFGVGPVISGGEPPAGEFISGGATAALINRVARDERVRAIVLRVNSPGGSAVGSDLVWRAVLEARQRGKPVVVSMGDVAGSGGYYISMGADAIVAEPTTLTGSIGVVYAKFNLGGLLNNLGVKLDYAKTAEVSDASSISRAMTAAELRQLNDVMGEVYATFTTKVASGRKLDAERAEAVAKGRVWSGAAAKERGLVDELGGLAKAVEVARDRAGIKPAEAHELCPVPRYPRLFGLRLMFPPMEGSGVAALIARAAGLPERWAPGILTMLLRGGVTLLSPPWTWRIL
jgi:protease-4